MTSSLRGIRIIDRWPSNASVLRKRCPEETRFMAQVWMPSSAPAVGADHPGAYTSKCFATRPEAETWAMSLRQSPPTPAHSHSLKPRISVIGPLYVEALRNRIGAKPVNPRHIEQIQQVVREMVRHGADDMLDPAFPDKTQAWLANLMAQRPREKKPHPAAQSYRRKFLVIARSLVHEAMRRRVLTVDTLLPVKIGAVPEARRPVFSVDDLRRLVADEGRRFDGADRTQTRATVEQCGGNKAAAARALGIAVGTLHYRLDTMPPEDHWWLFACLAAYTGARASEIQSLRWSDLKLAERVIHMREDANGNKRQSYRRIHVQPELQSILADSAANVGANDLHRPIIDASLVQMDSSGVYQGFTQYVARRGITGPARGPHSLRHTYCGLMCALGAPATIIMQEVGHKNVGVHARYSASAIELRDAVGTWPRNHVYQEFWLRREPRIETGHRPMVFLSARD